MRGERAQRRVLRGVAVHQHERQLDPERAAQRHRLPGDDVEERAALARLEQRLGRSSPIVVARPPLSLMTTTRGECVRRLAARQLGQRRDVLDGLEVGAREHHRLAALETLVGARERADRVVRRTRGAHLRPCRLEARCAHRRVILTDRRRRVV